jgi:predicted nuclease of restriction endonuclease-like (RecB) superfamily
MIIHTNKRINDLYLRIVDHIRSARQNIMRSVDTEQVKAYWLIGRDIIEEEQLGRAKAGYGAYLLQEISSRLMREFGKGFGLTTIKDIRRFYLVYSPIRHEPRDELIIPNFKSNLSWTHYRSLMRIDNENARSFYEIEASKNNWSSTELDRQVGSLLFDRLAKSKDKKGLMNLVYKGQEVMRPEDAIKDPMVLEFLDLPESHKLVESNLEEVLISNLQNFLLELGTGFAFVARQKRLTLDGDHFYTDLVFYHTILKCYVIIDIKTKKLTHADLGQMQLYVNYFDQEIAKADDNPTIGLILCTKKSNKMVKYFLGSNDKKIFTSKYQLHLPTEQELETELKREVKNINRQLRRN